MLSVAELATAMPRAGGLYYFLDRSLGPLLGTIGGLGTWLTLLLKVAFALVGVGAYLSLFFPEAPITALAVGLAVLLGFLNLFGAKASGAVQGVLVIGLLSILSLFVATGMPKVDGANLQGFFDAGFGAILSTTGLVYISYAGVTKIASLSEEVRNPERNIPLGIFLGLAATLLAYGLGTFVIVGTVPAEELAGSLTPVALVADRLVGEWGVVVITVAALLAFVAVSNAGILSASRYPLAMSRDRLVPGALQKLTKSNVPVAAIAATVGLVVATVVFLDPAKIAKLASAFQLLMFSLVCLAVIVMRESRIESYDPGYRSPLYPWTQIVGIAIALRADRRDGRPAVLFPRLRGRGRVLFCSYGRRRISRERRDLPRLRPAGAAAPGRRARPRAAGDPAREGPAGGRPVRRGGRPRRGHRPRRAARPSRGWWRGSRSGWPRGCRRPARSWSGASSRAPASA